jgi:hypothetical protein
MSNSRRTDRGKWLRKVMACPDCPSTVAVIGDLVDVRHEPTCPYAKKVLRTTDVPIRYKGAWV